MKSTAGSANWPPQQPRVAADCHSWSPSRCHAGPLPPSQCRHTYHHCPSAGAARLLRSRALPGAVGHCLCCLLRRSGPAGRCILNWCQSIAKVCRSGRRHKDGGRAVAMGRQRGAARPPPPPCRSLALQCRLAHSQRPGASFVSPQQPTQAVSDMGKHRQQRVRQGAPAPAPTSAEAQEAQQPTISQRTEQGAALWGVLGARSLPCLLSHWTRHGEWQERHSVVLGQAAVQQWCAAYRPPPPPPLMLLLMLNASHAARPPSWPCPCLAEQLELAVDLFYQKVSSRAASKQVVFGRRCMPAHAEAWHWLCAARRARGMAVHNPCHAMQPCCSGAAAAMCRSGSSISA